MRARAGISKYQKVSCGQWEGNKISDRVVARALLLFGCAFAEANKKKI